MADRKQPPVPFPASQQQQQQPYPAPGPVPIQTVWPTAPPAGHYDPEGPLIVGGHRRRRSACVRFWTTFAIAIVAWALLEVIAGFVLHRAMHGHWHPHGPPPFPHDGKHPPPPPDHGHGDWDHIIPETITARDCYKMDLTTPNAAADPHFPNKVQMSMSLPADDTFVYSGGPGLEGLLRIAPGSHEDTDVKVDIVAGYDRPFLVDHMKVCTFERDDGITGLGIFTPRMRGPRDHMHWERVRLDITLTIPRGLDMNRFDTSITSLNTEVLDLATAGISFKDLTLSSVAGKTSSQGLVAQRAIVNSSAGSISGEYNVSTYLELSTVAGSITATVNAYNSKDNKSTAVNMTSISGRIKSELKLYEIESGSKGGRYDVYAKAVNGAVGVDFLKQPMNSTLTVNAESVNGAARVALDPAYVGSFEASTAWAGASVDYDENVSDPSGKDRSRSVLINKASPRSVEGRVFWGKEGDESSDSSVTVSVVNGAARIVM